MTHLGNLLHLGACSCWIIFVSLYDGAQGVLSREPRDADDVTTPPPTDPPSSINKAVIIVPAVIVGVPIVIILLCVGYSYCCKCCDDNPSKVEPKWKQKAKGPVKKDFSKEAAVVPEKNANEFANSVLASMREHHDKHVDDTKREEYMSYFEDKENNEQHRRQEQYISNRNDSEQSGGTQYEGGWPNAGYDDEYNYDYGTNPADDNRYEDQYEKEDQKNSAGSEYESDSKPIGRKAPEMSDIGVSRSMDDFERY